MKKATLAPVSPGVEGEESTTETTMTGPLMYSDSNNTTDDFISGYFSAIACTISPFPPLLNQHKHVLFLTHMHTFVGFSYVARCPS